jgi:signal transduction histidine kinase
VRPSSEKVPTPLAGTPSRRLRSGQAKFASIPPQNRAPRHKEIHDLAQENKIRIDRLRIEQVRNQRFDYVDVRRFREKGVDFRSTVSNPDREIAADSGLLTHALINLLTNAIEAVSSVAQPAVELRVEVTDDAVVFAVRDNGPGIRDDEREQIFVPFHTTKPGGSGIGLSLARQIAIAHGGKLEVQPNYPGCVFLLTL